MPKFFVLAVILSVIISCTSQRDEFTPKRLGDKENSFRRSYLSTASDLFQDLYFAHQAFESDLRLLIKDPSMDQLNLTNEKLAVLRKSYNKCTAFRLIHGPLDYNYADENLSIHQYLFSDAKKLNILTIESALNGDQEITKEYLYETHLAKDGDVTLGISAFNLVLSKNDMILNMNDQLKNYLVSANIIMREQIHYLLLQWSPYEAGNFRALIQTRNQPQFLGWIYTSFILNNQQIIDSIKSQENNELDDLNVRQKALMNLWDGNYVLNDKRQYLRVGLKTLINSPEIDNYFVTLEKSRVENNKEMALEALYALNSGIKRAAASTYDTEVQSLPYIVPNIELHKLRTKRHYDKDTPFGENN